MLAAFRTSGQTMARTEHGRSHRPLVRHGGPHSGNEALHLRRPQIGTWHLLVMAQTPMEMEKQTSFAIRRMVDGSSVYLPATALIHVLGETCLQSNWLPAS